MIDIVLRKLKKKNKEKYFAKITNKSIIYLLFL